VNSWISTANGTTQYSYVSVGSPGALQLQQEASPLPNSAIAYVHDSLGRLASRTVAGAGAETFGYDAIGRLMSHSSDIGSFALSYLGQTPQIAERQLLPVTSNLATSWSYLPNSGDRRLASIGNTGLSTSQYSNYSYTTIPENLITGIIETSDASAVYPSPITQTASYNNLNQLTNLSGQALTFDTDGNLTSDGSRNYTWDAENRLVGITYPSQPGKQTAFVYDGMGRRTAIISTPAGGGSAVTIWYVWCGARICQARNTSNAVTREYFSEGELVPGNPAQPYYYGSDQIGSVRRTFATASSAPAYAYDPFGNALQSTSPTTDFGYADMFYNADSRLYLTRYRAYDPVAGRWLSRDPVGQTLGETGTTMLPRFADVQPVSDPSELFRNVQNAYLSTAEQTMRNNVTEIGANWFLGGVNFGNYSFLTKLIQENPASLRDVRPNLYPYVDDNPVNQIDLNGGVTWRSWATACYMLICWKQPPPPPPPLPPKECPISQSVTER
jgi:RHS repeat-associated protein